MKIFGDVTVNDDGMSRSIGSMNDQMKMLDIISQNISRFGLPGYQKQVAIKSSFAQYIPGHSVESVTDTQPGRIAASGNPLDVAIQTKGYFQIQGQNTVRLTRDGRFRIDKDGYLIALSGEKVLGSDGEAIKFKSPPTDLEDVKIESDGQINLYNRSMNAKIFVGKLGIASEDGTPLREFEVTQGHVEESNVNVADEFYQLMPIRRNFEANKQAFIIQNENITKLLQNLGRAQ